MIFKFDDFELDDQRSELRHNGENRALRKKVYLLLLFLLENRDRMVSRDEVIEAVWKGRIVSESTIDSCIKAVRKAIGDNGKDQRLIRTLRKQGLRFVGEVSQCGLEKSKPLDRVSGIPTPDEEERPTIAVMPFRMLGIEGPYEAIGMALPQDIITELAFLRWLHVTARESSFKLGAESKSVTELGAVLGAKYVLSGSVDLLGDQISVSVELSECANGKIVWGRSYRDKLENIHDVRSQIVGSCIAALDIVIPAHEAEAGRHLSPADLNAWTTYHLGLSCATQFTKEGNRQALAFLERAIEIDPEFARAHATLAFVHSSDISSQFTDDMQRSIKAAFVHSEKAITLDPNDPLANLNRSRAAYFMGDYDTALRWGYRAIELCPNFAQAIYAVSWGENALGRPEIAIDCVKKAMKLSPLDPFFAAMCMSKASAHFQMGQAEDALHWALEGTCQPEANGICWLLAGVYSENLGQYDKAKDLIERATQKNGAFDRDNILSTIVIGEPRSNERFIEILDKHEV